MASTDITLVIQAVDKATAELASVTSKIESLKAESEALAAANVALASAQRSAAAAMRATASESEKNVDAIADMRDEISSAKNAYENLEKASLKASASEQAENKVILGDLGRRIDGMKEAIRVARKLEGMGFNKKQVDAATASVREFNAAQAKAATTIETTKASTEKGAESLKSFAIRGAAVVMILKKIANGSQEMSGIIDATFKTFGMLADEGLGKIGLKGIGTSFGTKASVAELQNEYLGLIRQIKDVELAQAKMWAGTEAMAKADAAKAALRKRTDELKDMFDAYRLLGDNASIASITAVANAAAEAREKVAGATREEREELEKLMLAQQESADKNAAAAEAKADALNAEILLRERAHRAIGLAAAVGHKASQEILEDMNKQRAAVEEARAFLPEFLMDTAEAQQLVAGILKAGEAEEEAAQAMRRARLKGWWKDLKTDVSRFAFDASEEVNAFIDDIFDRIESIELPEPEHIPALTALDEARIALEELQNTARVFGVDMSEATRNADLRVLVEEASALADFLGLGAINADALFAELSKEKIEEINESLVSVRDVAGMIGDGFANAFMSIIDGSKSVAQAFGQMAASILADVARMLLSRSIANMIGAAFGGASFKRFQHGGAVVAGAPVLVGERGPELFVPRQSGYVNNASASRSGGATVVHFNIAAVDGPSVQAMLMREADTIKAVVTRAVRGDNRFRAAIN